MTVTIERVFELTDEDIERLACRWDCHPDEVKERIENGDFEVDELHYHAFDEYHDYSTILIK